jgi:hypothetical protein
MAVREPDGTLRKAQHLEREKLLNVYFPRPGKTNFIPPLFEAKNLEVIR